MEEKINIRIKYKYFGVLAGGSDEYEPKIIAWSTTIRSEEGVVERDIPWKENEDDIKYLEDTIILPLKIKKSMRMDDALWFEILSRTESDEKIDMLIRCGMCQVQLFDICEQIKKGEVFKRVYALDVPTVMIHDEFLNKGTLMVEIKPEINKDLKKITFDNINRNDFIEERMKYIQKLIQFTNDAFEYPLIDDRYKPMTKNLIDLKAPNWQNNVILPISYYWIEYSAMLKDEFTMKNMVSIVLRRKNVSEEEFLKVTKKQFEEKGNKYDTRFTDMMVIFMNVVSLISISLPYKTDETFKLDFNSFKKIEIESFNDGLRLKGDDCEGLEEIIHRVFRLIEQGNESKKDESIPWKREGSWTDPILQMMQKIAFFMMPLGTLGEVTSNRIGTSKEYREDNVLIIDSKEDKEAEYGYHMWWELCSVKDFELLINRTIKDEKNKFSLYGPSIELPEWHHKIPHFIGEGTGWVYPLLRPMADYYDSVPQNSLKSSYVSSPLGKNDNKTTGTIRSLHQNLLNVLHDVSKNTQILKLASIEKLPDITVDIEDARLTGFYRSSERSYTDKLKRNGYNYTEFIWNQLHPRHQNKKNEGRTEWMWGVNTRDKLYKEDFVSIIPLPELSTEEEELYNSMTRHLCPLKSPILTPKGKNNWENRIQPKLDKFQSDVKSVLEKRMSKINLDKQQIIYHNFVYNSQTFLDVIFKDKKDLAKKIQQDVMDYRSIVSIESFVEPICDDICVIRFKIGFVFEQYHARNISSNSHKIETLASFNRKKYVCDLVNIRDPSYKKQFVFGSKTSLFLFKHGMNQLELQEKSEYTHQQLYAYYKGLHYGEKFELLN